MPCLFSSGNYQTAVLDASGQYDTETACADADALQTGGTHYLWIEPADAVRTGSFDIGTAQTLIGYALAAFAVAYTFRMLRDMILNRR